MSAADPEDAPEPADWIFGYGSLIWRPDFPHVEARDGWIEGWTRRFWQGSTDHRGVPEAPGRVVTLVREPGARCWGRAFRIDPAVRGETLARLDHRERGGFERDEVVVHAPAGRGRIALRALVYVATAANPNYLGPASLEEIAQQVAGARGPSGPNREYVLELARALRAMRARDDHVFDLAERVAGRGVR
jgi:cation transport regulator ChaC